MTDRHFGAHLCTMSKPCIVPDCRAPRPSVGEPSVIVSCIIEIVSRAIVKVMQTGLLHGMICGPDPHIGRDVGKFAHGGVGNVGEPVAIGIVVHMAVRQPAAASNLDVLSECRICNLAIGMDEGSISLKTCHQWPPSSLLINLRRNQPDNVSMAITIKTMRTM